MEVNRLIRLLREVSAVEPFNDEEVRLRGADDVVSGSPKGEGMGAAAIQESSWSADNTGANSRRSPCPNLDDLLAYARCSEPDLRTHLDECPRCMKLLLRYKEHRDLIESAVPMEDDEAG
jgi:hypothetical protein